MIKIVPDIEKATIWKTFVEGDAVAEKYNDEHPGMEALCISKGEGRGWVIHVWNDSDANPKFFGFLVKA